MSTIPSKLLKLKNLQEVPRSEYSDLPTPDDFSNEKNRLSFLRMLRQKPSKAQQMNQARPKELSFNAAVWLSFTQHVKRPVSLWLSYKDANGESTILVDEQCIGESASAMLSGNVSIKVTGNIEYLRACCGGIDQSESLVVEELHVRRLENEVAYNNPIQQTA